LFTSYKLYVEHLMYFSNEMNLHLLDPVIYNKNIFLFEVKICSLISNVIFKLKIIVQFTFV